jgi:VWFA-related protein
VVVTGRDEAHLGGLSRGAFKIEERGKTREVTIFEEVRTVAADAKSRPAITLEGRSNFNFGSAQNWRMTMVVMDMLNTPYLSQVEGKRRLIQYLSKSLQREEPMSLFGLGTAGLRQIHSFTTDTAVLLAALKKVQGQVGPDEVNEQSSSVVSDATAGLSSLSDQTAQQLSDFLNDQQAVMNAFQQRESIRTTLTAMTQIAHAYAAIPGRKTLIWASGGFPFMIDDPQAFARMGTDFEQEYEETWRSLNAANIAVYTVDVTGISGTSKTASGNFDAARSSAGRRPGTSMNIGTAMTIPYDKAAQRQETLRAFADATGGVPCVNTNNIEKCFARAVDDSRSYYMLGYYLPADDQQVGWRKLKVKVSAEGAHVRAREGFYLPSAAEDSKAAHDRQIVDALRSPVEFTGVRMNVREVPAAADPNSKAAGKSRHEFAVGIIGDAITVDTQNGNAVDMTVIGVAFSSQGVNVGHIEHHLVANLKPELLEKVRQSGVGVNLPLELGPGKYDLRFAVRDNLNGEIGSVEYPLEVK